MTLLVNYKVDGVGGVTLLKPSTVTPTQCRYCYQTI